jgi:hypothetical protein
LEKIAPDRTDLLSIHCQHLCFQLPGVDVKIGRGSGGDQPEQDRFSRLHVKDFRIVEWTTIGQQRVIPYVDFRGGGTNHCSGENLFLIIPNLSHDVGGLFAYRRLWHFLRVSHLPFRHFASRFVSHTRHLHSRLQGL